MSAGALGEAGLMGILRAILSSGIVPWPSQGSENQRTESGVRCPFSFCHLISAAENLTKAYYFSSGPELEDDSTSGANSK